MDVSPTKDTDADAHGSSPDIFYHCYLIASMLAGLFYILLLVEAAASDTYKYIRSYSSLQTAEEFVDRVRDARPLVRWHAVCYHFEYRQAGHTSHMGIKGPRGASCRLSNGGPAKGQIRYKEKVLTYRESEALKFNRWKDITRDIKGFFSKDIVRVSYHY